MDKKNKYYIYIILCDNGAFYTGITNNLANRFKNHKNSKGANYTKIHKPLKYLSAWSVENRSIALSVEYYIKSQSKSKKIEFVNNNSFLKKQYCKDTGKNISIRSVYKKTIKKINLEIL